MGLHVSFEDKVMRSFAIVIGVLGTVMVITQVVMACN